MMCNESCSHSITDILCTVGKCVKECDESNNFKALDFPHQLKEFLRMSHILIGLS